MTLRETAKRSPVAPVMALPFRVREAARATGPRLTLAATWLFRSKEISNFTYDLTAINREHLAWFVAQIAGKGVGEIRGYLDELEQDESLRHHVRSATLASDLRHFADPEPRYGRRIGWYALIFALRPEHIVETGTDKGLGSCVLAAALLANGTGQLTTIDLNPESGYLITGRFASVTTRVIDDSLRALAQLDSIDFFLHDSDHTLDHESRELDIVTTALSPNAFVLSDNAHWSDRLPLWAETTGRHFAFFHEEPRHWYRGGGIGAAWL